MKLVSVKETPFAKREQRWQITYSSIAVERVAMFSETASPASPVATAGTDPAGSPVQRWRAVLDRLSQTRAFAYLVDDTTSWMNY